MLVRPRPDLSALDNKARRFTASVAVYCPGDLSCRPLVQKGVRDSGDRYGKVVQRKQGIWVYPARQRWQGCFRAHFSCRESRPDLSYEEMSNRGKTSAEN